ncbi:unnamed protein product [Prunus armeniaca]
MATGTATAKVHPNLWKPRRLELMNNDLPSTNPEDSMSCFDLSKNESYLMSATGGMLSVFDMTTFKNAEDEESHATATCGNLSCFSPLTEMTV